MREGEEERTNIAIEDYLSSEVLAKHEGGGEGERTNIAIMDYLSSLVLAKY